MRLNHRLPEQQDAGDTRDPREGQGAQIIDLATRNVLPAVTQRRPKAEGLGLAAGILVVAGLGAVTLWSMDATRTAPPAAAPGQGAAVPAAPLPADLPPLVPLEAITPTGPSNLPAPPPQEVLGPSPQGAPLAGPVANPYATPTVIFDSSALPLPLGNGAPGAPQLAPAGPTGSPSATPTGNSNDDFASRIGGVGGSSTTAAISFNPKTTIAQGTLIPAVLETAIDTDVPGFVRAVVSADVRSFDGTRVLVPRSSRLVGQYKSGVQAGQKRAYVIWTRLIRPDGVSVSIASPAIGFNGETGLRGDVDTHFFERFGSALLLSVVGGLSALSGNAGVVVAGNGQSAAAAAVGQSGSISPTIRVRQGEPIRVFTARDLDFSRVSAE